MTEMIKEFLKRLISITQVEYPLRHFNSECFYESVFEIGRSMNLNKNFKDLFTDEDKSLFKEKFKTSFLILVECILLLTNNLDAYDLNIARKRLSELTFFKIEIINLYKEISGDKDFENSKDIKKSIDNLDENIEDLAEKISIWTAPDYPYSCDDLRQVPNLNGVPETHKWWNNTHRDLWENKSE